jgi:Cytochrome c oxidase subunit IV
VKVETLLFSSGVLFFSPIAIIYGIVTQWHEPVGVAALLLTAGLAFLIGLYLWITARRIEPRPEDDPYGEIRQGFGEQGVFAPYSWWPLPLAFGSAVVFAGMAVGVWMILIGLGISSVALVGWVFEYYRGEHAH